MSETDQENLVKESYTHVEYLMARNTSDNAIIDDLIARGMRREGAAKVVAYVAEKRDKQKLVQSKKIMISGAVWFFVGTLVLAASSTSTNLGGAYFFAGGVLIYGAIQFVRGYLQRSASKSVLVNKDRTLNS